MCYSQVAAFQTLSVRAQLALVNRATVALSPPGGVSMVLPFMPEGSQVILINYQVTALYDTSCLCVSLFGLLWVFLVYASNHIQFLIHKMTLTRRRLCACRLTGWARVPAR